MDIEIPDTSAPVARNDATSGPPALGRRLLGAGLAGLAASLLPGLGGRVAAQSDTTDEPSGTIPDQGSAPRGGEDEETPTEVTVVPRGQTPDETDATTAPTQASTTTEPPRLPTSADVPMLGFVQQISTTIVGLYDQALNGGTLDESSRALFSTIRESHQSYGQAVGAMLGQDAPGRAELPELPALAELDFGAGSLTEVAEAASTAEAIAMATHIDMIGRLEATEGAGLLASMAVIEARHRAVLADVAGRTGVASLELPDVEPLEMAAGR